jgi:hypothetical protein
MSDKEMTTEQLLAIRKQAGLQIDPETAEVDWIFAQTLDPYGVDPDLPEEYQQVGREYFARSPESDIWVWFGDLPDTTRDALYKKHGHKLTRSYTRPAPGRPLSTSKKPLGVPCG